MRWRVEAKLEGRRTAMGKSIAKTDDADAAATASVPPVKKKSEVAREFARSAANRYAFLVGATLVLLIAIVLLWQTWMVLAEHGNAQELEAVRAAEGETIGKVLAGVRERVLRAATSDEVTGPLAQSQ